jgi:hypothetical protein
MYRIVYGTTYLYLLLGKCLDAKRFVKPGPRRTVSDLGLSVVY